MITGTGSNGYISRNSSSWLDLTADWTISFYVKYYDDPAGFVVFKYCSSDFTYTQPYIFLENSSTGVRDLKLEVFNGTGTASFTPVAAVLDTDYYISIRYTESTHTIEFIIDGVVQESKTLDLTAFTDTSVDAYLNDTGSDDNKISIAYERIYQRVLTTAEILAEKASITPVNSTGILASCPLQASIDLTDHLGQFIAVFFATGTVETDTDDPLLSIVAGPPSNTTPATAIELTADSAYFQNTLASGAAAPEIWYKRTCTVSKVWGAIAFGDLITFKPTLDVYQGLADANADITYLNIFNNPNAPVQFPAVAGNDYYFRSSRNGAVSPATVIISVLDALDLPVPIGSIAVNSEVEDFPLALLDATTGYPIHFVNPFPAGEGGNPLADGTTLVVDITNTNLELYDAQLNPAGAVALFGDLTTRMSSNETDTFLVGTFSGIQSTLKLVAENGTINPTDFNVSASAFRAIGLNVNATVAYYSDGGTSTGQAVKAWDLVNNVALPNLVAGVTDFVIDKDIIVLQDGTILVARNKNTVTRNFTVTRYDSGGSVQSTYDFGDNSNNDNRIATDVSTANFWIWIKGRSATGNDGFSIFQKIKVSDGSILINTGDVPQYDSGSYTPTTITNTPIRFGASESCPFWITRVALFPAAVTRSGIYYLTGTSPSLPTQRHDTLWIDASLGTSEDVKIP